MSTSLLFDDLYSPRVEPLPSPQERLLSAVAAKADRERDHFTEDACAFVLAYLREHGPTPGEQIVDACKASGLTPADDRAFGPVFHRLSKQRAITVTGYVKRSKGNGTGGGNVWGLA